MKTLAMVVVTLVSLNACGGSENDSTATQPVAQAPVEAKPSTSDAAPKKDTSEEDKKKFLGTWKFTSSTTGTMFDKDGKASPLSTSDTMWASIKDAGAGMVRFAVGCDLNLRVKGNVLELTGPQTCDEVDDSTHWTTTFLTGSVTMGDDGTARVSFTITGTADFTNGDRFSLDTVSTGRLTK